MRLRVRRSRLRQENSSGPAGKGRADALAERADGRDSRV